MLSLPVDTRLAVIVAAVLRALSDPLVPVVPHIAMVLPIPKVVRLTPVLSVAPQVVTATPNVPILAVAIVSPVPAVPSVVATVLSVPAVLSVVATVLPVPAVLSVVATVLPVALRLPVLPLVTPVGIPCRIARALIGSRGRLSRCIARSARALCIRKRQCRCERRADGHRQEVTMLHDTSSFADQQRSTILTIP